MGTNWVDLILASILILTAAVEMKRGFGKALFDLVAAVVALKVAALVFYSASTSYSFISDGATNKAFVYSALFVVIGAVCWFIGKQAYDHTLVSMEMFDPSLGVVLGIGVAVVVGHAFTNAFALMSTTNGILPSALVHSRFGMEFYDFQTYHAVITTFSRLAV